MPPKLSARQLLWAGLVLTAVGVFVGQYLFAVVYSTWGADAIDGGPLRVFMDTVGPVLLPLGVVVLGCSLIARVIESPPDSTSRTNRWRPMPPRLTARQIFWSGVILAIVGTILMAATSNLFLDLSGRSDLSANLARDLWNFLGFPLTVVAVPLGIALVPCAFVVRMLESRVSDPQGVSAEASHP